MSHSWSASFPKIIFVALLVTFPTNCLLLCLFHRDMLRNEKKIGNTKPKQLFEVCPFHVSVLNLFVVGNFDVFKQFSEIQAPEFKVLWIRHSHLIYTPNSPDTPPQTLNLNISENMPVKKFSVKTTERTILNAIPPPLALSLSLSRSLSLRVTSFVDTKWFGCYGDFMDRPNAYIGIGREEATKSIHVRHSHRPNPFDLVRAMNYSKTCVNTTHCVAA